MRRIKMARLTRDDMKISSFEKKYGIPRNAIRKTRSDEGKHIGYTEEQLIARTNKQRGDNMAGLNYTKGNWRVINEGFGIDIGVGTNYDDYVAHIFYTSGAINPEKKDRDKANANLISASPDMYEALKKIADVAIKHWKSDDPLLEPMLKAINKAEGK
jgi:hypothetical protein